ncbi:MAG: MAPEG family protein [Enterobacteriaceae bacterium]
MVSTLYVVLSALLLLKLSIDVIKLRKQYQVRFGDGGFYELQTAIRIHGNATEYLPIGLLLLVMMEMNGAENWMVHICGILLLAGRIVHYLGLHRSDIGWRRSGMVATFLSLILMCIANLYYMPWDLIVAL